VRAYERVSRDEAEEPECIELDTETALDGKALEEVVQHEADPERRQQCDRSRDGEEDRQAARREHRSHRARPCLQRARGLGAIKRHSTSQVHDNH
jgi:hypothetical protein